MKPADQISEFVREAMAQGGNQDQIAQALADAGWSAPEVEEALHAGNPRPACRRCRACAPMPGVRGAALRAAVPVAGRGQWNICDLVHGRGRPADPDPVERVIANGYDTTNSGLRWPIATLIVFTPLFLYLNRKVATMARSDAGGGGRWCANGWPGDAAGRPLVFLGDGIYVIYALLNGELTARFAAKAALVAGVTALVLPITGTNWNEGWASIAIILIAGALIGVGLEATGGPDRRARNAATRSAATTGTRWSGWWTCLANANQGRLPDRLKPDGECSWLTQLNDPFTGAPMNMW